MGHGDTSDSLPGGDGTGQALSPKAFKKVRLSDALKANMARRKAQARARRDAPDKDPEPERDR